MASVVVSIALDTEKHRQVIAWLKSLKKGKRSETVAEVLMEHVDRSGVTLGDVYQAVKELERKLHNGALVARNLAAPDDAPDEPPDVAANLDSLGL
jgi:hypothetical protein